VVKLRREMRGQVFIKKFVVTYLYEIVSEECGIAGISLFCGS